MRSVLSLVSRLGFILNATCPEEIPKLPEAMCRVPASSLSLTVGLFSWISFSACKIMFAEVNVKISSLTVLRTFNSPKKFDTSLARARLGFIFSIEDLRKGLCEVSGLSSCSMVILMAPDIELPIMSTR